MPSMYAGNALDENLQEPSLPVSPSVNHRPAAERTTLTRHVKSQGDTCVHMMSLARQVPALVGSLTMSKGAEHKGLHMHAEPHVLGLPTTFMH
jgi:hypothetical protein